MIFDRLTHYGRPIEIRVSQEASQAIDDIVWFYPLLRRINWQLSKNREAPAVENGTYEAHEHNLEISFPSLASDQSTGMKNRDCDGRILEFYSQVIC